MEYINCSGYTTIPVCLAASQATSVDDGPGFHATSWPNSILGNPILEIRGASCNGQKSTVGVVRTSGGKEYAFFLYREHSRTGLSLRRIEGFLSTV